MPGLLDNTLDQAFRRYQDLTGQSPEQTEDGGSTTGAPPALDQLPQAAQPPAPRALGLADTPATEAPRSLASLTAPVDQPSFQTPVARKIEQPQSQPTPDAPDALGLRGISDWFEATYLKPTLGEPPTGMTYEDVAKAQGMGDFAAGMNRGMLSLRSLGRGAVGAAAQLVGADDMARDNFARMQELQAQTEPYSRGRVTKIEDIMAGGSPVDWMQSTAGELLPSIGSSIVSGLIGGALGTVGGPGGTVGSAIAGTLGQSFVKKQLASMAGRMMATTPGLTSAAAQTAAKSQLDKLAGAGLALFANSYVQGVGDIAGETLDENGRANLGASFLGAVPYALLDSVVEMSLAGKILKGAPGESALKRMLREGFKSAIYEGGTETAQEGILMTAGLNSGKEYAPEEVISRLANSFAMGAFGGGVMGTVGGIRQQPQPRPLGDVLHDVLPNDPAIVGTLDRGVMREALNNPQAAGRERTMAEVESILTRFDPQLASAFHESFAEALAAGKPATATDRFMQALGGWDGSMRPLPGQAPPNAGQDPTAPGTPPAGPAPTGPNDGAGGHPLLNLDPNAGLTDNGRLDWRNLDPNAGLTDAGGAALGPNIVGQATQDRANEAAFAQLWNDAGESVAREQAAARLLPFSPDAGLETAETRDKPFTVPGPHNLLRLNPELAALAQGDQNMQRQLAQEQQAQRDHLARALAERQQRQAQQADDEQQAKLQELQQPAALESPMQAAWREAQQQQPDLTAHTFKNPVAAHRAAKKAGLPPGSYTLQTTPARDGLKIVPTQPQEPPDGQNADVEVTDDAAVRSDGRLGELAADAQGTAQGAAQGQEGAAETRQEVAALGAPPTGGRLTEQWASLSAAQQALTLYGRQDTHTVEKRDGQYAHVPKNGAVQQGAADAAESAPAPVPYRHLGILPDAQAEQEALDRLRASKTPASKRSSLNGRFGRETVQQWEQDGTLAKLDAAAKGEIPTAAPVTEAAAPAASTQSANRAHETAFLSFPQIVEPALRERPDRDNLYRAAGVADAGAFQALAPERQARAYAQYVAAGGAPVEVPGNYNDWVQAQYDDAERRRNEPVVKRDQFDYNRAQTEIAAEMGLRENANGELIATDEQFAELNRRLQARRKGEAVPAPETAPSSPDILRTDGTPFKTAQAARTAARNRRLPDHAPVPVEGGWALRKGGETEKAAPSSAPVASDIDDQAIHQARTTDGRVELGSAAKLVDVYRSNKRGGWLISGPTLFTSGLPVGQVYGSKHEALAALERRDARARALYPDDIEASERSARVAREENARAEEEKSRWFGELKPFRAIVQEAEQGRPVSRAQVRELVRRLSWADLHDVREWSKAQHPAAALAIGAAASFEIATRQKSLAHVNKPPKPEGPAARQDALGLDESVPLEPWERALAEDGAPTGQTPVSRAKARKDAANDQSGESARQDYVSLAQSLMRDSELYDGEMRERFGVDHSDQDSVWKFLTSVGTGSPYDEMVSGSSETEIDGSSVDFSNKKTQGQILTEREQQDENKKALLRQLNQRSGGKLQQAFETYRAAYDRAQQAERAKKLESVKQQYQYTAAQDAFADVEKGESVTVFTADDDAFGGEGIQGEFNGLSAQGEPIVRFVQGSRRISKDLAVRVVRENQTTPDGEKGAPKKKSGNTVSRAKAKKEAEGKGEPVADVARDRKAGQADKIERINRHLASGGVVKVYGSLGMGGTRITPLKQPVVLGADADGRPYYEAHGKRTLLTGETVDSLWRQTAPPDADREARALAEDDQAYEAKRSESLRQARAQGYQALDPDTVQSGDTLIDHRDQQEYRAQVTEGGAIYAVKPAEYPLDEQSDDGWDAAWISERGYRSGNEQDYSVKRQAESAPVANSAAPAPASVPQHILDSAQQAIARIRRAQQALLDAAARPEVLEQIDERYRPWFANRSNMEKTFARDEKAIARLMEAVTRGDVEYLDRRLDRIKTLPSDSVAFDALGEEASRKFSEAKAALGNALESAVETLEGLEPAAEAKPAATQNTVFTDEAAEKAREVLRRKLGQLNSGIDPEMILAGITLAGWHIEKGARTFAAYSQAMIADLGEAARPYLRQWYEGVRQQPGFAIAKEMTPYAELEAAQRALPEARPPAAAKQSAQDSAPTQNKVAGVTERDLPVADLALSRDVPQFKMGANQDGVVEPLGGTFDPVGVAPIQVWERLDGRLEVISGRHRLDLARRSGLSTIRAQVHREADGVTVEKARALDAELNIRDGQGKVIDYVDYFQARKLTRDQATKEGIVARNPGRRAFEIATSASDETVANLRANRITEAQAEAIAAAAPGDAALQAVGIAQIVEQHRNEVHAVATMQALQAMRAERQADANFSSAQGDMFGFDDSAMREAEQMAKAVSGIKNELGRDISAISGASKDPVRAKRFGIDVQDSEAVKVKLAELRQEKARWDAWHTNPDLVARIRAEMAGEGRENGKPVAALQRQRDEEERVAQRKRDADADLAAKADDAAKQDADTQHAEALNTDNPQAPRQAWVSPSGFEFVTRELERLNRRAKRMGLEPLAVRTTGNTRKAHIYSRNEMIGRNQDKELFQKIRVPEGKTAPNGFTKTGRMVIESEIEIVGEIPRLGGWDLLGIIDHMGDDGNVVRGLPGKTVPKQYRDSEPHCDHCHTKRARRQTFILQQGDELKQCGRSCLVDFLGTDNAELFAKRAELVGQLAQILDYSRDIEDETSGGGWRGAGVDLHSYLPAVAASIRAYRWTSRSAARDNDRLISTADDAFGILFSTQREGKPEITEADRELAKAARDWAEALGEQENPSDLDHNMSVIAKIGMATDKQTGIAAYIVQGYLRAKNLQEERANKPPSSYRGAVGERLKDIGVLTVKRAFEVSGDYGVSTIHILEDANGNIFKWKTGTQSLNEGERINIEAAKVVKHEEYKGTKQTSIQRPKIGALPPEDAPPAPARDDALAPYDAVAQEYGFGIDLDGTLYDTDTDKRSGLKIVLKRGRMRVERKEDGTLTGSYPAQPEAMGRFLESFTGAKRRTPNNASSAPPAPASNPAPSASLEALKQSLTNDIPLDLATRAYEGTSHTPEARAKSEREAYVTTLLEDYAAFRQAAEQGGTTDRLESEFASYRAKFKALWKDVLASRANVASAMIVGPARFPTARNQKRMAAYEKRMTDALDWRKRTVKNIVGTLNPAQRAGAQSIKTGDADAVQRLSAKLAQLEAAQQRMKDANKVLRSKQSDADKVSALVALGYSDREASELLAPDFAGRIGFSFQLTNNNAEINRTKERLAAAQKFQDEAQQQGGKAEYAFDGGIVELDYDDNRLRIIHDAKPTPEVLERLEKAGFKWSRQAKAWQRQLTGNAKAAAQQITGVRFAKPAEPPAPAADTPALTLDRESQADLDAKRKADEARAKAEAAHLKAEDDKRKADSSVDAFDLHVKETNPEAQKATNVGQKPLFSLADAAPAQPASAPELQALIANATKGWAGLTGRVKIDVVQHQRDLPADVRADAQARGKRVKAVWLGDRIILVADNLGSFGEAMKKVAHEAVGHHGTRAVLGPKFDAFLDEVLADPERNADIALYANAYGRDMTTLEGRREAADEYLAHLAELGEDADLSLIERAVQFIRNLLRDLGVKLRLSDRDIRELLKVSRQYVQTGRPAPALKARTRMNMVARRRAGQDARFSATSAPRPANAGLPDTIEVDGVPRPTTNSNGQPIHPTREGVENFWRWFGDSKVVDAQGRPLVMYHGTSVDKDYTAFKVGKRGVFFTSDPEQASEYAEENDNKKDWYNPDTRKYEVLNNTPRVFPVYLKIENPYKLTLDDKQKVNVGNYAKAQRGLFATIREHDGVKWLDMLTKEWVVLRSPTQIKSAIGNDGTFSPSDPDLRHSLDVGALSSRLRDRLMQRLARTSPKTLNFWNETVGTPYHLGKKDSHFQPVFEQVKAKSETETALAVQAETLAADFFYQAEGGLGKAWAAGKRVKAAMAPARIASIFQALNEWAVDRAHGNKYAMTPDMLRARGLDDGQIGTFHQQRQAVAFSLNSVASSMLVRNLYALLDQIVEEPNKRVRRAEASRISKSIMNTRIGDTADAMDAVLQPYREDVEGKLDQAYGQRQTAQDILNDPTELSSAKQERAQETIKNAERRIQQLEERQEKIEQAVKNANRLADKVNDLLEHGYSPLMRFGKFTVTVTQTNEDPMGKVTETVVYFGKYESESDMHRAAEAQQAILHDNQSLRTGISSKLEHQMYQGLNMDVLAMFADHLDTSDPNNAQTVDLVKEYIRLATADPSSLKRQLEQKGTPGYNENMQRVLAEFIVSNARTAAANLHQGDIADAIEAIPKGKGDVKDYAIKLVNYLKEPGEEFAGLRSFMFYWYLGGSVASAVTNMTALPMVTAPYLSQFKGLTPKLLGDAFMQAIKGGPEATDTVLHAAFQRAKDEGVIAPQAFYNLSATARGGQLGMKLLQNPLAQFGLYAWALPFSWTEQMNRATTFIAAHRIAGKNGLEGEAAYKFAEDAVHQTQFIYGKYNRPNWARGIGAPLFTFKMYTVGYLELLSRMPRKQQAIMLGALILAAGLQGLPGEEDLEDLIDTLARWMGYDFNSRDWLEETTEALIGQAASDVLHKGVSDLGLPFDLHSRLGMGNLIPGTRLGVPEKGEAGKQMQEVVGPVGGIVQDLRTFLESAVRGDGYRAGYSAMPRAIKHLMDGGLSWSEGAYIDKQGRPILEVSPVASGFKAIGFHPRAVARHQEDKYRLLRRDSYRRMKEDAFLDRMARAKHRRDSEAYRAAQQAVKDWNRKNPDDPIEYTREQIKRRVKMLKLTSKERFMKSLSPELRSEAAATLQ